MSRLIPVGDLHLGHMAIPKYRTQFSTVEEHDEYIFDMLYTDVNKRDSVIFMGDTVFSRKHLDRLHKLPAAKKTLVLGNHCSERINVRELCWVFDEIHSALPLRNVWFTHIPIHDSQLRGRDYNIHAHLHDAVINHPKYINCSLEQTNMRVASFSQLIDEHRLRWSMER